MCSLNTDVVTEKKNVFMASIGNLPPKQEVTITLVYVTELEFDQNKKVCAFILQLISVYYYPRS